LLDGVRCCDLGRQVMCACACMGVVRPEAERVCDTTTRLASWERPIHSVRRDMRRQ
jgi:hypothetical protein